MNSLSAPGARLTLGRMRSAALALVLIAAACAHLAGCAKNPSPVPIVSVDEQIPPNALVVPGNAPWMDTGVDVVAGQPLTISAKGRVAITRLKRPRGDSEREVGPAGTFFYDDRLSHVQFPLAAAGNGPAPCFCLIGRIGHGPAFYVGPGRSWVPEQTGRLWLGINDADPSQNVGDFYAEVGKPSDVQPVAYRQAVPLSSEGGEPLPDCNVVVFYIDGLRPDVVEEMAAMGHIPNLRTIFVDGGTHLMNAFTAFPSDTITSNGTMWTGCFSDRHGLKGQVRFSRTRLKSESFLETLGPSRSSRHMGPKGIDKFFHETQAVSIGLVSGANEATVWRESKTSSTPVIYDYLRAEGADWATGILPIMTDMPPPLWTRSMARALPYFDAQEAWRYIDDANADFAVRHLIRQPQPVTIIWLPETDSVSHKECRGQFGSTRRTIARADRLVGGVVSELAAQRRLDSTYLILVSDHGHLGGRDTHLSRFDLADELFFNPRQMTRDGRWVGGGLGLSVRQHRFANWHSGDKAGQFVFIDADSDGAARIFLPRGDYKSGEWIGGNSAAELLAYRIAPHLAPINLPETLANARAAHDEGAGDRPIDLVLMKLDEGSIVITTADRGKAVIQRRRAENGRWEYRYTPVEGVSVAADGGVACREVERPSVDPLGLVRRVRPAFLKEFHSEQAWLLATASSDYPDGVVTLTRHMLWQDEIKAQEKEFAPDLVVTARHGWLFSTQNTPGTTHGYPLADSVRATWYVSGPNIRRGAKVEAPCRLADLTPTILALTGAAHDPEKMDGHALRNIFDVPEEQAEDQEGAGKARAGDQPEFWQDVDLRAWQPLPYTPSVPYEHLPKSINQPSSGWDLNNFAYNAISIGDWSVFQLMDNILTPITPGQTKIEPTIDAIDRRAAHARRPWVGDGVRALNVPEVSLSDYSPTSIGNIRRVDQAVDWLQERGTRLDSKIANRAHRRTVLGAPVTNKVIDSVQGGFWEAYRWVSRLGIEILDEMLLNNIENGVDSAVNAFRKVPSEVIVE
ncbi:MAG: alkaline phosphatase family protein [Planctomycetia bacterium]|nr:alkaline phosphatase family protein [Planctomycetia bacterium]